MLNTNKVIVCHFESQIACSFWWQTVQTVVKFLDGFFLKLNPNRWSVFCTPLFAACH